MVRELCTRLGKSKYKAAWFVMVVDMIWHILVGIAKKAIYTHTDTSILIFYIYILFPIDIISRRHCC